MFVSPLFLTACKLLNINTITPKQDLRATRMLFSFLCIFFFSVRIVAWQRDDGKDDKAVVIDNIYNRTINAFKCLYIYDTV